VYVSINADRSVWHAAYPDSRGFEPVRLALFDPARLDSVAVSMTRTKLPALESRWT